MRVVQYTRLHAIALITRLVSILRRPRRLTEREVQRDPRVSSGWTRSEACRWAGGLARNFVSQSALCRNYDLCVYVLSYFIYADVIFYMCVTIDMVLGRHDREICSNNQGILYILSLLKVGTSHGSISELI